MNYIDLFSGIGGFRLGAKLAGLEFVNEFHSDISEYANKVYIKNFPQSIQLGDIREINTKELMTKYGNKWIVSGGFPCQDISIAGKGKGIRGERSGLWFEMWRIIRGLRPRFVLVENVGMFASRGLSTVLGCFAKIGYDAEWQDIRASDVGAPHRRERIWIIAYPNLQQRLSVHKTPNIKSKFWLDDKRFGILDDKKIESLSKSDICGVDDGVSGQLDRYQCLGNSIVPQIAELLFCQIKKYIENI